jgi:hypothetical protein
MTRPRPLKRFLAGGRRAALVLLGALTLLLPAAAPRAASAAESSIAIGEVSGGRLPGTDASIVKIAAEGELRRIDRTKLPSSRMLVVSLAVAAATDAPVACTINATVHDARTGAMLAIVEGRARTEGRADGEVRAAVVRAAVKSAVGRISEALPKR